jgi:hypothetical protein
MTARRLAMLWLCAVLVVSAVVRAQLVFGGGQMFWGDEGDYSGMTQTLADGDVAGAAKQLGGPAQYFVFKLIWTIPDALAYAAGTTDPIRLFFGFVSLIHIVLVWCIARRIGGSPFEAAAAATLTAAATTMLYYGRHFLPYDCAMAIGLFAIWIGVKRGGGPVRSAFVGLLAAATVLTYAGYWTLAGAALAIHLAQRPVSARDLWRRTWPSFACFVAGLVGATLLHRAVTGGDLRGLIAGYATTVDQGTFSEGWSLPWEYLWHAEHGLLLLWGAGVASFAWRARRAPVASVRADVVGLVLIYGALVVFSVVLGTFVVYGRLARQLVPFLSLITARELARAGLRTQVAMPAVAFLAAGVVAQSAFNFRTPLHQVFPSTFRTDSLRLVPAVKEDQLMWINLDNPYPYPHAEDVPAHSTEVAAAAHPLTYLPYQYEGWKPEERAVLRATDLRMRLVVINPTALSPP